jgi:hypothetical protein
MEQEDYSIPKKIIDKKDITMERIERNKYTLNFTMENKKIYMKNIINFNIMKILYEVNKDLLVDFKMKLIDDKNGECYFLLKHLFSDFGLPQKYIHLDIEKIEDSENNTILFVCKNSTTNTLNIPKIGEQMSYEAMFFKCKLVNNHCISVENNIFLSEETDVPAFVEKMVGIVTSKMFIKIKQFIENVTI